MSNPRQNKEAIGKGIRSLLQHIDADLKTTSGRLKPSVVENATGIIRITLERIDTNPKNPRKDFDETALQQLADSMRRFDVVQPITVSAIEGGRYRLISGERRFRAARLAGLKDIPAYIRQANDHELLELALLENLQREDLNSIEVALSYKRMMDELHYTQEQVAERMSKERSTVTNYIRLLRLPPDIQIAVRNSSISMGHARALITIENIETQLYIFNEVKSKGLSVRQTEELVRKYGKPKKIVHSNAKSVLPAPFRKMEDTLASHFETKVKLTHSSNGAGSIHIEYYSLEELNRVLDRMQVQMV